MEKDAFKIRSFSSTSCESLRDKGFGPCICNTTNLSWRNQTYPASGYHFLCECRRPYRPPLWRAPRTG